MEEEKLRRKLDELMSDKALSSDEDEPKRPPQSKGSTVRRDQAPVAPASQEPLSSSSDEMPTEAQKVRTLKHIHKGQKKCSLCAGKVFLIKFILIFCQ